MTCTQNSAHFYGNHLENCPWCEREAKLRPPPPKPQRSFQSSGHSPYVPPPPPHNPTLNTPSSKISEPWTSLLSNGLGGLIIGLLYAIGKTPAAAQTTILIAVGTAIAATLSLGNMQFGPQFKKATSDLFWETTFCMSVTFGIGLVGAMAAEAGEKGGIGQALGMFMILLTIGLVIVVPVGLIGGFLFGALVTAIRRGLKI